MKKSAYEHVKAWRSRPENKSKRTEEARRWREKHPDVMAAIKERFKDRHGPDKLRKQNTDYARKRRQTEKYKEQQKIRVAKYKAKRIAELETIAGRLKPELCEICNELNIRIVFDHCHQTGKFRGWICDRCNKVLGLVKDNPSLLMSLAAYLNGQAI